MLSSGIWWLSNCDPLAGLKMSKVLDETFLTKKKKNSRKNPRKTTIFLLTFGKLRVFLDFFLEI